MSSRILIVDDDLENLSINKSLLENLGYHISIASNGPDALNMIKNSSRDFALILMDYHMPHMNGAEVSHEIIKCKPHQQILAFSLDDTREVMRKSFKSGVLDFLDKNADHDIFLKTIQEYCDAYEAKLKPIHISDLNINDKYQYIKNFGMIGCSQSLFELCQNIEKVAPSQASVLILGESGTGKELVARALHKMSSYQKGNFVAVNIAAEPANLLDSSLFGHKKGSFTGANQDFKGKFQQADNGTLFLDEIGDLHLDLQVKLLRVLQEKEIIPLGGAHPIKVNARIVAATHKDLSQLVKEGKFREDLYYRLCNIQLQTIPLRERLTDIEPLIAQFTQEICKANSFQKSFQRRCLDVFKNYTWPGNIRELRSVVEKYLILSESKLISESILDFYLHKKSSPVEPTTMEEIDAHTEQVKKALVQKVINNSSSKAEASRRLGVAPNRLHYFLVKWGMIGG